MRTGRERPRGALAGDDVAIVRAHRLSPLRNVRHLCGVVVSSWRDAEIPFGVEGDVDSARESLRRELSRR